MDYISTRDTSEVPRSISSAQAIKTGIAPDGGLFMPTEIPHLAPGDIEKLCGRVAFLHKGRLILSEEKEALLAAHPGQTLEEIILDITRKERAL